MKKNDFRVLMVLYKEDYGDVGRIVMDVYVLEQLLNLLDYCCTTEKYSVEMSELQDEIERMLSKVNEQNRLENKSV